MFLWEEGTNKIKAGRVKILMAAAQSSSYSLMVSKFRGCLVGSHVGDCFGEPFEFRKFRKEQLVDHVAKWTQDKDLSFTSKAKYTDDTVMTLCIADSLTANKGFDAKDMATRFVEEYETDPHTGFRNYGTHVPIVFKDLRRTNFVDPFGPAAKQFQGSGSYGNGSAMRVAPVALYTCENSYEDVAKIAKKQSLITHSHQHGYNGAILQCLAIQQALKTNPDEEIDPIAFVDDLIKKMSVIEKPLDDAKFFKDEDTRPYYHKLQMIREIFRAGKHVTAEEIAKMLGNDEIAHWSVPTATYSFLKSLKPSEDFEHPNQFVRAMYHAVSVAGDTDTIAAMTGSISGAYHGIEAIPQSFRTRCQYIEKSEEAADRLHKLFFAV